MSAAVYTVPPGRPFLTALAEAILAGHLPVPQGAAPDPLALPDMTILLPTRRAARALQEAFLNVHARGRDGGGALLLPAIRPIAESDEDLGLIQSIATGRVVSADEAAVPEAIDPMERLLLLTRLVLGWSAAMRGGADGPDGDLAPVTSAGAGTPAQAAGLAQELARLMDMIETESVSLEDLGGLVPETLSEHWQQTLDFLKIVVEIWPAQLEARGQISPMDRRNRLILAEAARIRAGGLRGPVIVAGVTGSVPATAELMAAVLSNPNGAIVLPALDQSLEASVWDSLLENHPEHPQHGFRRLLDRLGVAREAVRQLTGPPLGDALAARNRLISEALRPSGSTAAWRTFVAKAQADRTERQALEAALHGLSLIEAPSADDEAEVVALILREALETPGRTAALVSPDRLLARRVAVRLESWGIRVDDSAGRPFAKTMPGAFLDLVIEAWAQGFAPAALMALLKHPLTRLGLAPGPARRAARIVELAAFRAPYLGTGLRAVSDAIERAERDCAEGHRRHMAVQRLSAADWAAARDLVQRLEAAVAPLMHLADGKAHPLATFAEAHSDVAEAIANPPPPEEAVTAETAPGAVKPAPVSTLWQGEAGEAAAALFARLAETGTVAPDLAALDYPDFYRALIAGETVRVRIPVHPRLAIWGPFEARLQQPDVVILGSLNEGTWPKAADPGPWLNRPMRQTLGLPSPEDETGRAAHDVTTFLGAAQVYLTRATKVDGVPQVPSRWLLRLNALVGGGLGLADAMAPKAPWLAWARARTHMAAHKPAKRPEPRPPLDLRPRRASVSDIETWLGNPYAIYAKRILRLEPLPALGVEPGVQEKGQMVHAALSVFTKRYPDRLPADVTGAVLDAAAEAIEVYGRDARVRAFWLPRLKRFAQWFAETEAQRRDGVVTLLAEVPAKMALAVPGKPFMLTARADRIDVKAAGLVITDYKTGSLPKDRDVNEGRALQLPLEAAMAAMGSFPDAAAMPVETLRYIRATGSEPPGEMRDVKPADGQSVADLARQAIAGVIDLVAQFDDPATPYAALRRPEFRYDFDDYAHLARVGEWAGEDTGDEEVQS